MTTTKEDLYKLLELQDIDAKLRELERSKKIYPEQLKELEQATEKKRLELEEIKNKKEEHEKLLRHLTRDIESANENLSERQKRLTTVQSNKEYDAIQHEIESAKNKIEEHETEMLGTMEALDTLNPELEKKTSEFEVLSEENSKQIAEIKDKYESIEINVDRAQARRRETLQNISKTILKMYERLSKRKKGVTVASVSQKRLSCGGCHKIIPPQKIMEIKRQDKLINCEICGAILVWDNRALEK